MMMRTGFSPYPTSAVLAKQWRHHKHDYRLRSHQPHRSHNVQIDGTLRGSGTIVALNATTVVSTDAQQGVRFRGLSPSDFSGLITSPITPRAKSWWRARDHLSPVGTGRIVLVCGEYDGGNVLTCQAGIGYNEFNIRNNGSTANFPTISKLDGTSTRSSITDWDEPTEPLPRWAI